MPELQIGQEFREQGASTRYPFVDKATLTAADGTSLDEDIFLDASLYPIGFSGELFLREIDVQDQQLRISISSASRGEEVAFAVLDLLNLPDIVAMQDGQGRPAGVLVSDADRLARFGAWTAGTYTFSKAATTFVPACVIPTPESGVRGIQAPDGTVLSGELLLVGQNGVVVRQEDPNKAEIRIDVVGDPLFRRKLCSSIDLFTTDRPIRTINGCSPDANGNFELTVGGHDNAGTVVRIYQEDGHLVIAAAGG